MSNIKNRITEFKEKNALVYQQVMEQMAAHFDNSVKEEGGVEFIPFCSTPTLEALKVIILEELDKRGNKQADDFFQGGRRLKE